MDQKSTTYNIVIAGILFCSLILTACTTHENHMEVKADPVAANIKNYSKVWDEIMNKGKLDMFNDSNFTKDVVMHASPADVVGIDSSRAYYANFLTGFSNIQFTIKDIFGQGDKLVNTGTSKGHIQACFLVSLQPANQLT